MSIKEKIEGELKELYKRTASLSFDLNLTERDREVLRNQEIVQATQAIIKLINEELSKIGYNNASLT